MSDNRDGSSALIVGFVVGAALGAGIALLMAPDSGEETRRRIGETAKRIKHTARHRFEDLKDTLVDRGKEAVSAGRDTYDREMQTPISREPA